MPSNSSVDNNDTTIVLRNVPKKIREMIQGLKKAGFVDRGDKGNHRNFKHPCKGKITVSGNPGQDAKKYQEREVGKVIREVKK